MQTKQERIGPCEVELEIQVDKEKVDSAFDEAYKELGKAAKVPGFRKGKAPKAVLKQFLGEDLVKEHAAEKLIKPAYDEAVDEAELEPFGSASVEMVKFEAGEPLIFKAKVPLRPKVKLGQYVGLEVERKVSKIEDSDIDSEINDLLERYAEYVPVTDRPVAEGDFVTVDVKDDAKPEEEPKRETVEVGNNIPEFDKAVVGMQIGEEKAVEFKYPDDHPGEELRGKAGSFSFKVVEIREKRLPELTDEWVKNTFAGDQGADKDEESDEKAKRDIIDSVEKLRSRIREAAERAARQDADARVRDDIVKQVVESSQVDYPSAMVTDGVEERMGRLMSSLQERRISLDDYLNYIGKTLEDLRSEYEEEERRMLRTNLVLHEIKEKEGIQVEDKDVDAEIQRIAEEQRVTPAAVRAYVERTGGEDRLKARILYKKIMDFLVGASNIKNVGQS